ncbi:hypothetical protein HBB16_01110 [Pseudonocardia sp. MCCB 268]|nr:hypothetical protein [Pseudonocardia cytotoxica]
MFFTREVRWSNSADDRAVRTALEQMAPAGAAGAQGGSVEFQDLNPVPVARSPARRSTSTRQSVGVVSRQ